jgi:hypothetical protein
MVAVKRRVLGVLAIVAIACAPAPGTPREIVDAYFASMGRDPLRTLPLVTPAFHAQHGVGVVTNAEAVRAYREGDTTPVPAGPVAIDHLELGWLMIQVRPAFARRLAALERTLLAEETSSDTARVAVRLAPREGAPFEQEFTLVRNATGTWQIDAIAQRGVDATNGFEAFIAHPTDAARRRLEAALRDR